MMILKCVESCPIQEVYMAAAPMTISADRQLYINFSAPFDLQPYTFMHALPKETSKALLFVDPFTPLVRRESRNLGPILVTKL